LDKRLLIVLPLCLAIVIGWQMFMLKVRPPPPRPQPGAPAQVAEGQQPPAANPAAPAAPSAPAAPVLGEVLRAEKEELRTLRIGKPGEKGSYELDFSNRGGALVELHLGDYFDKAALSEAERADSAHWTRLVTQVETAQGMTRSFLLGTSASSRELAPKPLEEELWTMRVLGEEAHPTGVEFKLAPGTGVVFTKRFTFLPGRHELGFELEIENTAREGAEARKTFVLTPIACMPAESADQYYVEPQAVACAPKAEGGAEVLTTPREDSGRKPEGAFALARPPLYAGVQNKYFATLLREQRDEKSVTPSTFTGASWRLLRDEGFARAHPADSARAWKQVVTDLQLELVLPAKGQKKSWSYVLYAGPKEREQLAAAYPEHALLTKHDLGFFTGIASVLLWVLGFLQSLSGNWGVAIILLTILVRGILFPINRRSQVAMGRYSTKMKRLQPKIEELKKRYANDRGKLAQEQQKLLQQEGAFPPLGGCLPMFLQIPVFFGLFAALRVAFDLRQAHFLWIPDLSLPDHTFHIHGPLVPILGSLEYLNILPPLMIGMWIWQQRGMPVPADEQAAKMQKMMMWMPIVMGVFLYNYAAGLSLYMITQSGLGVFEQKFIKKHWPPDSTEQTPKGPGMIGKMMARAQAAQVEAERLKRQRDSRRR
jgi:YidC/Oxa1 family membrane protein insertase